MDEPTTHLDEERREELVNILSSFFREGGRIIPQMLIITHHPEIVDVADVVYVVSKKEGYSNSESGSPLKTQPEHSYTHEREADGMLVVIPSEVETSPVFPLDIDIAKSNVVKDA